MLASDVSQALASVSKASQDHGETDDCAVKALAFACNVPYSEAHDACRRRGREPRKGTYMWTLFQALRDLGGKHVEVDKQSMIEKTHAAGWKCRVLTVGQIGKFPQVWKGTYLIVTNGHILTAIDGHVFDYTAHRKFRILQIYKIVD